MTVPVPSFPPQPGESPGEHLARIVRHYAGCSLEARRDELGALVARGVDEPEHVVTVETNCAMFALGVLKAAGCPHELLDHPYVDEMAFAWLVKIGTDLGAWRDPGKDGLPTKPAALWYRVAGRNVDHVEFLLSLPDEHGGGGRTDNAITVGRGDWHESWGRPLYRWLDPDALNLPDAAVEVVDEVAHNTLPPSSAPDTPSGT